MNRMQLTRRATTCRVATLPWADGRSAARLLTVLLFLTAIALAGPAYPQWRAGAAADPAAALDTRAGNLAGYAQMVDTWGDRLSLAVQEVQAEAPADTQEGALSRPRMRLLDVAQTAWMVIKNVPEGFGDRAAYEAAERQFELSLPQMGRATTSTPDALAEVRKIIAALERLEAAAVEAARMAAR